MKIFFGNYILLAILFLLSLSCKKDIQNPIPAINTANISGFTIATSQSGGEVTDNKGSTIIEQGIVWSSSTETPSLESKTGKSVSNNLNTPFSCVFNNLLPNTTYYVRAYASNAAGTGYGKAICFVSDAEGNVYRTIKIGNQTWMQENLRTVLFNDGSAIPHLETYDEWINAVGPAYSWYDKNVSYKFSYGALYNFYTVKTGKLAPIGWRVSTKSDWETLSKELGGEIIAGGKLKEAGTKENNTGHWLSPNTGGTNESGFTALPGGGRSGLYFNIEKFGFFWTSTEYQNNEAYSIQLDYNTPILGFSSASIGKGFSVRCIKDN